MSDKTINELVELTDADDSDELAIFDVSAQKTKKITKDNFLKNLGKSSVTRFDTEAEAIQALSIPIGQDGYLGDDALVIVDDLNAYVKGESR